MMLRNLWPAAGIAFLVIAVLGIWPAVDRPTVAAGDQAMILATDPEPLKIETKAGERSFTIEVADDPVERERGLMFRESMGDDHGMLFVFEDQRDVGFWMKNTPMPLDLIFIAQDGTIKAIKRGEPFSEAIISPGEPVRFVLELKAGTSARNGIAVGDEARHKAIDLAPGPAQPAQ